MSKLSPARALALAVLAFSTARSQSPIPAQPFTAAPQALREAFKIDAPADTPVIVLLEEAEYSFDANGAHTFRHRLIFQALTRAGADEWAMITRRWAPWHQDRPEIRARVITSDGSVHELDQKTIADEPASEDESTLNDERVLRAPLPAMEPGSIVEQQVSLRESSPISRSGSAHYFYFGGSAPVKSTRLTVSVAPGKSFQHAERLLPGISISRRELPDGRVETVFQQGPMDALRDAAPFLAPEQPRAPYVVFSTGAGWQAPASEYAKIVDQQIGSWKGASFLPGFEPQWSRDEKIRAILTKMNAEVRYTGVEFGEASVVPRAPAEVLKRKYGDCKDKSALLVALLRAAGIEARVALLLASRGADIEPDYPGLDVFNHAIVYVPGKPDLWIDPTDPDARVGTIAPDDQGRLALVADEKTTALVRTPEATSADNRTIERREFRLAEVGSATVTETTESWGTVDRDYRSSVGRVETKKVAEQMQSYASWTYASTEPPAITRSNPDDLSKPFQIRLEIKNAARGTSAQTEAAVGILLSQATIRLPEYFRTAPADDSAEKKETDAKRSEDFVVPEAFAAEWRYRIIPAPGFRVRKLPDELQEKLGPASLSARFETGKDGGVTGTVKFELPKRRFSAAEGKAMRDAVLALQKRPAPLVYFDQIGETLLAAGKVKESLAEFRDLQRLHPREALHCDQMARALLAAGAGEAARAEARRAVQLEPKSAHAYANLATVLKHDLVGRLLKKGYDRAGAVEAYRKAVELDPANDEIRANMAILLEYDESGERYAAGAQLGEAITEYRKIEAKLADLNIPENLAVALFRAERMKELREYLRTRPDSETNRALKLAATAVLEGSKAAIEAAARDISGVPQQRKTLFAAAQNLLAVRRYDVGADLLAAGASEAANPAGAQSLADLLRTTRRAEDIAQGANKPEDAVKRLFVVGVTGEYRNKGVLLELFSQQLAGSLGEVDEYARGLRSARAQLAKAGMSFPTAMDLTLSLMRVSMEGSDEEGYRIRLELPGPTAQNLVFFVVRENGRYRIVGGFGLWDGVARLALSLAESGQIELARKWLDRARDELQPGSTDDALSPPMFTRVWNKGQNADKAAVKRAAAVLLATAADNASGIPILEESGRLATTEKERRILSFAVATAYARSRKNAGAGAQIAEELVKEVPDSRSAFALAMQCASMAGDRDRAERLANEGAGRFKTEPGPLRAAANALLELGADDRAASILRTILATGKAEASDYNLVAWSHLLAGSITDATTDAMQRAMLLSRSESTPILHTVAAIQAETGKPSEARVTLLQRMELAGSDEPNDDDWYVFGRIAECYGLPDAARSMYARVARPKDESGIRLTSYALAQRRLKALAAPSAAQP